MSLLEPNLEDLVPLEHDYRVILKIVNFEQLTKPLEKLYSKTGKPSYPVATGFKCLILQFMHDMSDRELENYLKYNIAAKLFCDFKLSDKTPDHSYFNKLRTRIGVKEMTKMFNQYLKLINESKLTNDLFAFVDSTQIKSCIDIWEARDKMIEDNKKDDDHDDDKTPTMNNSNIGNYTCDKDAKFGCKGKSNFWVGFKRHVSVDTKVGIITNVRVTPANYTDPEGLKKLKIRNKCVLADKIYSTKNMEEYLSKRNSVLRAIMKNNNKFKNKQKDNFLSSLRMPYEGVFSKINKVTRYRGLLKVQFQALFQAFTHNLKKHLRYSQV